MSEEEAGSELGDERGEIKTIKDSCCRMVSCLFNAII
jgi:hypothetical protein